MAAQWADDFGSYGTTKALMLNGLYAEAHGTLMADPNPSGTGQIVYRLDTGVNATILRKVLSSNQATVGIAARYWFAALPAGAGSTLPNMIQFRDGSNSVLITVCVTSTGAFSVYRGNSSTGVLLGTSDPALTSNTWGHVEAKVFHSATVGTVEIRVNGLPVLDLENQNTSASPCGQVVLSSQGGGSQSGVPQATIYARDFFVWDATGARNNDFAGSVSVIGLDMTADVSLNWTPSTGIAGYSILDNIPPNDAQYIFAPDPAPSPAVFDFANLPVDVTSVRGLMTLVRARNSDGGDGSLQVGLISGGDTDLGANHPITVAFTYYPDWSESDPDTGNQWIPTAVDLATLQLNRTV